LLRIRRFVRGVDEPVWVEVLDADYKEYESWWRGINVEEMREREKRPSFDFEGRFFAELDEKPVGLVYACADTLSEEKKGLIHDFCVIPEFRGHGVEEKLAEIAINELEKHGMNVIQAWTGCKRSDRMQLLEELDFKRAYKTFDMEIDLSNVPSNIGENTQVTIRSLRKNVEEDIKTLNWLTNECYKEFPNYSPRTIEVTRNSVLNHPHLREQEIFFAVLDRKTVGYTGVGIDEKYNTKQNVKSGRISRIGVLKTYRRKGIGTRLILQGLKSLKAKSMIKAMVDTEDNNPTNAVKLYEKVGFKVVQEYLTYEKRL